MEIKELTKEYFDKVAHLAIISISDLPYYNHKGKSSSISEFRIEKLEEKLVSENDKIFVAVEENNLLGCVRNVLDEDTLFIAWIFTDYRHRNKGFAKELLNRTIEFAKEKTCHKVWCDTRTNNKESIAFFTKMGFQNIAELKNHWYGLDYYILEKVI